MSSKWRNLNQYSFIKALGSESPPEFFETLLRFKQDIPNTAYYASGNCILFSVFFFSLVVYGRGGGEGERKNELAEIHQPSQMYSRPFRADWTNAVKIFAGPRAKGVACHHRQEVKEVILMPHSRWIDLLYCGIWPTTTTRSSRTVDRITNYYRARYISGVLAWH